MNLSNKVIILTGGTSGIGYELVRQLDVENKLIVIAREGPKLESLREKFPNVDTYPADLSKPQQYTDLAEKIMKKYPRINLLINNAAVQNTPTYLDNDFNYGTITHEINLNFNAICSLSYLLIPALINRNDTALIVNINSGLALAPKTNSVIYCATKAAIDTFSRGLSYQLEKSNIRVLQAFLPLVETPMTLGRSSGKISAHRAASAIISGIEKEKAVNNIGKVKILRLLMRLAPSFAYKIMKQL